MRTRFFDLQEKRVKNVLQVMQPYQLWIFISHLQTAVIDMRLSGMIWQNRRGESTTERRMHGMTRAHLVS